MHRFDDTRVLPYGPRQVFDLVADVARYPEFLPWCLAARVGARQGDVLTADLVVGTRILRETFTSRVTLGEGVEPLRIDVDYIKGPMRSMENHWLFHPHPEGTRVEFHVAFSFHSRLLEGMMGRLFDEASRKMIAAFEKRARALYGAGTA